MPISRVAARAGRSWPRSWAWRALDLTVVAEGVETELQATMLMELGCDRAQGYLFGKAMALDDLISRVV